MEVERGLPLNQEVPFRCRWPAGIWPTLKKQRTPPIGLLARSLPKQPAYIDCATTAGETQRLPVRGAVRFPNNLQPVSNPQHSRQSRGSLTCPVTRPAVEQRANRLSSAMVTKMVTVGKKKASRFGLAFS